MNRHSPVIAVGQPASGRPSERPFRRDINGLRAWAVVAVILYHFGVPGFPGGFVGVDIFFVISGFLMTGIVFNGLSSTQSAPHFSILGFYLARARRIVPPLVVLCLVLLIAGWLVVPGFDYRQLGQHTAAALGFLSNIKFWMEDGYFNADSHEKWLLHTWSLSVEWQFYLLLPVAMVAVWRISPTRQALTLFVAATFCASLAASILLTPLYPTASFYLLHTRAWEMLAGGLVLLLSDRLAVPERWRSLVEVAGFTVLGAAILCIDSAMSWPGGWALVPVSGTVLVLLAGRQDSVWTGNAVTQWLGTISYSLYLWHWPIVVALSYLGLLGSGWWIVSGLVFTLAAGQKSYRLIEQGSHRLLAPLDTRWMTITIGGIVAAVAVPGVIIYRENGIPGRLDPRIEVVFDEAQDVPVVRRGCGAGVGDLPECRTAGETPGAIVIGDSHGASVINTIKSAMPNGGRYVLDWTILGCPTLRGVRQLAGSYSHFCGDFVDSKLAHPTAVATDVPLIIVNRISHHGDATQRMADGAERPPYIYFDAPMRRATPAFFAEFRHRITDTACRFARSRPVYLMRPVPEMPADVPHAMGRALQIGHPLRISTSLAEYNQRNHVVIAAQDAAQAKCGVHILDPRPYLCDSIRCWGDVGGLPIYSDDNHLSGRGAKLLEPMFREIFE